MDPGYYKPNDLNNALTAHADSHNVILIDGQGAPDKGLLTDFGDTDAFLENTLDGTAFDYAEARQSYRDMTSSARWSSSATATRDRRSPHHHPYRQP